MKNENIEPLTMINRQAIADLNALRAMAGYMEQELSRIAPGCASMAGMLERAIHAETRIRQTCSACQIAIDNTMTTIAS
jgi:hypothetical protein